MPLKSNCADAVHLPHVMEHVRDLVPFMEEVYRICKPGTEVQVTLPCDTSRRADRFRIEAICYDTREPFRYLAEYLRKRCRRHLWNVVENMAVTIRVVKP